MKSNRKGKILIAGSLLISTKLFVGSEDENEDEVFELQSVTKSNRRSKVTGSEDLDQDQVDPNGSCNVNFIVEPTSIVTTGKLKCVQTSDLVF